MKTLKGLKCHKCGINIYDHSLFIAETGAGYTTISKAMEDKDCHETFEGIVNHRLEELEDEVEQLRMNRPS
jgi:hypothetical protein